MADDRPIGPADVKPKRLKGRISRLLFSNSKKRTRWTLLIAHTVLLAVIAVLVVLSPTLNTAGQQNAILNTAAGSNPAKALDQLSSADIAVHISRAAQLEEATAVTNYADTVNAQLSLSSSEENIVAKPQVPSVGLKTRKDITTYVTAAGDTVASVADKFGVTSDTIRWSNKLSGNKLAVGTSLIISPINGIVYTVKAGDTIDGIARKYNANKDALIAFNDAELRSNFEVGERIIIPGGSILSAPSSVYFGFRPIFGASNGYDRGYCTWWAAYRRQQIGRPLPSNLGNACTWASRARAAGIPVSSMPSAGAVIWNKSGCLGHVGFVERVRDDGSIIVSDMNSRSGWEYADLTGRGPGYGGWNVVSYRLVTPDQFGRYQFIL